MDWKRVAVLGLLAVGSSGAWAMTAGGEAAETQLSLQLPTGVYRCAYGEPLVGVERGTESATSIKVHYRGAVHELQREASKSGLPRYASDRAGLLWIDLPWKSVLLNLKNERPIANDCTYAPEIALAQLANGSGEPPRSEKPIRTAKKR